MIILDFSEVGDENKGLVFWIVLEKLDEKRERRRPKEDSLAALCFIWDELFSILLLSY